MEENYQIQIDMIYKLGGKILIYLKESKYRGKSIFAKDLQKRFGIGKATASEYLSGLESKRLIERIQNGRSKEILLTELGEKLTILLKI